MSSENQDKIVEIRARLADRWYDAEQTRDDARHLLVALDAAVARAEADRAALLRGRRIITRTIEAVTPEPCRCAPMEFCGECLAIKTLEEARAALAAAPGDGATEGA